ncbi:MAG: sigma-70 family RNA polymerase sigma factor, partial [Actinomycetota bacterium]|nr:sigma-70 family RNA polymerase sigma factor [Actinomycetota bacterium]
MRSTDPLRDLFDAAREGDDRAVRELVTRTQPVVWRVCSVLGSAGEEEDLVQETYLRALRSAAGYRGEAPVQAWLLAIARNVCADHVRRRARQRRLVDRLARTN